VRYLTLAEALVVAQEVTGLDVATLARSPRLNLLDSALHGPQASFGSQELYPDFIEKGAVLEVRIARNYPLLDGNKRLSWACLNMFL
jgi:death-on-curing protein